LLDIENKYASLRHINEDKRKTEAQRQFFDVVYEVDGCPVSNFSEAVLRSVKWLCASLLPLQEYVWLKCNSASLNRFPVFSCNQAVIQPLN